MKKLLIALSMVVFSTQLQAEDLESSVRDFGRNGDWASFKIADNTFGLVMGTRAFAEDERTGATIAFNYATQNKCQLEPVEFIYKLKKPSEDDSQGTVYGNIQVDSGAVARVEAKVIEEAGSEFLFIVVEDKKLDSKVKYGKKLTVNFNGYGVVEFSLNGAKQSIENAKLQCENHAFDE